MLLHGVTARTRDRIIRKLDERGRGGAASGAAARGVTWVKVTGAISSGWYPGVVSLDLDGTFADESGAVEVKEASGGVLVNGNRYPCTRTQDKSDGTPRFRTVVLLSTAEALLPTTDYTITATNAWEATGLTIDLPAAGTYILYSVLTGLARISATAPGYIRARLWDVTNSNAIPGTSSSVHVVMASVTGLDFIQTTTWHHRHVASAAKTVRVEVIRDTGPTWTTSKIIGTGGPGSCISSLGYSKVA